MLTESVATRPPSAVPPQARTENVRRGEDRASWAYRNIGKPMGVAEIDPMTGRENWYQGARDFTDPVYRPMAEGATLGLGDEAKAAGAGIASVVAGDSFSEGYNKILERERAANKREAEKHPVLNTALKIVGTLGTALPAKGVAAVPVTGATASKTGGRVGAGYGAAAGFGEAEGGAAERLEGAAAGTGAGYALGRALPYVVSGLGKVAQWAFGKKAPATPGSSQLKAESQAKYAQVDFDQTLPQPAIAQFADDLSKTMKKAGIDPTLHPRATATLKRITDAAGDDISLQNIDTLRQIALDAGRSNDAGEQRLAGIIIDKIDDMVDQNLSAAPLAEARALWHRLRKAQAIEDAMYRAKQQADRAGSGGNIDNAIRQQISALLTNKSLKRTFTAEERVLMERVVKGTPGQHLARLLGKMSPEGNGLALMLQTGAAMYTAGTSAPLMAVGAIAKRISDAATKGNVAAVEQLIQSGQVTPQVIQQLPPKIQALLRVLIPGGAAQSGRSAGNAVSTPQSVPAQ
jgi:hypothetical protein